jgi:metal-binding ABC transporter (probably hemin), putative|nr:ABC transporter substrate-binding protein [uncultured Lachnoanaerobaculum sp.]
MNKILNYTLTACISLTLAGCAAGNNSTSSTAIETTVAETTATVANDSKNTANAAETVYPVSIQTYDADGNEITQVFEKSPERIITNNLSSTELLIDLGLQDKIVGMLDPDNEVTGEYALAISKIPHIGDKKSVSKEVVLSNNPDIIIGRNMMFSDKSLGSIDSWNQNSIPVYTQKASVSTMKQSLENVIEDVRNIGIIFNIQDKANKYADELKRKVDSVISSNSNNGNDLKNALIMCAYNDETFGAYKSALQESILNTVLADVPAISNNKIMTISYDEFMDYGTSTINALADINTFLNK